MRILDVRHEQTAVFAAEAVGKLTRVPGLAVLTAGPGVTNGVSADHPGAVQRLAAGRRRRPGPGEPLGHGQPAGAGPPAAARAGRRSPRAPCTRSREIAGAVDEAFTLAGSSHRGPTFLDVPMDQFFDQATVERPAVRPRAAAGAGPGRPRAGRRAARRGVAAGAGARHRRVGGRRRGGGAAARRGDRRPGRSPTAWAAAWSPAATRCWSPRPASTALGTSRPGRGGRHAAGLPARLRRLRRQGRRHPGAGRAPRRLPRPGLAARRAGGLRVRRPDLGARRRAGRPGARSRAGRTGRRGSATCRTPSPRPSQRDASCCAPRPTRSTRPGSTASWSPGWPTTRW